ncbi:DUF2550 domain-containing protein [Kibdelosporangium aridum]|uniref:DUF2550 domain-containing protein n=1 Tax=Kibdelosporangium aridum TaxID=2030 RepID=A0A1Y5XW53_KIBAR|nr:DUF2550 domain-containing protein [Kibdelosporangium aridum]SMD20217.1 Protein of unknown function [Kibdelosporangium aridum]
MEILWFIGTLLAVAAATLLLLGIRRVRLIRMGGINVALRTHLDNPRGWHLGVARYHGDEFTWYRALSLRNGPNRIIQRDGFEIDDRREPEAQELYGVPNGAIILRCRAELDPPRSKRAFGGPDTVVEIAMTPDALTGFLSWLESAPPGRRLPYAS